MVMKKGKSEKKKKEIATGHRKGWSVKAFF